MSEDLRISSKEPITPIPPPREGRLPSSLEAAIEQVLRTYPHDEQAFKVFEAIVKAAPTDDLRKGLRLLDEKRTGVDDPPGSGWAIEQMRDIIITELQNRGIDPYQPPRPPQPRGDEVTARVPASGVAEAELSFDDIVSQEKPSERVTKALEDAYQEFAKNKAKGKLTKTADLAKKYGEGVGDILNTSDFSQILSGRSPNYIGLRDSIDKTKKLLEKQPNNEKLQKQLEELERQQNEFLEKLAKQYD